MVNPLAFDKKKIKIKIKNKTIKCVHHFWQSIDAILEDVYVTETSVWCVTAFKTLTSISKNYGSPIFV